MLTWRLRLLLSVLVLALSSIPALGQMNPTPATTYLQQTSDRYQETVDVYTDADAAGNHFAYRGKISSTGDENYVPDMDEISSSAQCHSGITCITATFDANGGNWGGWYFMNGVLGSSDRQPQQNWGTIPRAGYDLTGATKMQFWARGANGGEKVEFFSFGVGYDQNGQQVAPYPDSSRKISTGIVTLSTTWTQYEISLTGQDVHYVLGGFGWVASAVYQANQNQPITFYLDDIQFVKARPAVPRFLVSYETILSTNSFDTVERNAAFVYDNAVAMIALSAAGDRFHARTIETAMLYGQSHDRFFSDQRLRNAYQGGDIALPPGWLPNNRPSTMRMPGWYDAGRSNWFEDEAHVSSNTGNIAWAMLALLYSYETTHNPADKVAVERLGRWVIHNTWDADGQGGFTAGYDGWENGNSSNCASGVYVSGQCKLLYKSTEHNIDLYSAFSRLFVADHGREWRQAAQHAKAFFLSMWDPTEGKFWTGTLDDGVTARTDVIPVDIQAWAIAALGSEAQPYLAALQYVEAHHKTAHGYGFKQNGNNSCGDNSWFEGTSQVALAYLLAGDATKWQSILDEVHAEQGQTGAVPATDGQCLNTGFLLSDGQPWEYYPRAHVGATAWLSLAENGVNPFRASLYSPKSSPVPTIASLSPSSVSAGSSAQTVIISGSGFVPRSTVTYNGTTHTAIYLNSTQLNIFLSAGDQSVVGSYPVVVINPAPGGGASNPVMFAVNNAVPGISNLSPSTATVGSAAQTLTINGTNFVATSTVTYNGAGRAATFVSSTQLTILLSAADQSVVGSYPVVVTNPAPGGGASNPAIFTVNNAVPGISSLSPSAATVGTAAQILTINGSNFLHTSTVTYNGAAHTATYVNSNRLTILLSASDQSVAGSFAVVATNPAPGGGASNPVNFTVNNLAPGISSVSPSAATVGTAAQTLTINGTNFLPTSTVTYNGAGHTATYVNSNRLTILLRASDQATAGTYPVVVTNPAPGGGASNPVNFTVNNLVPGISSLSPSAATVGTAAQTLTINGANFLPTSTVTYNGAAHTATYVNSNRLTILLSASDQATTGTYPVVVTNPAPGGGASNSLIFTVNTVDVFGAPTYFLAGNWTGTVTVVEGNNSTTYNVGASISQTVTSLMATLTVLASGNVPETYTVNGVIGGNTVTFGTDISAVATISLGGLQVSGGSGGSTGTMTWDGLNMLSGSVMADGTPWTGTITTTPDRQHLTGGATSPSGDSFSWNLTRQ